MKYFPRACQETLRRCGVKSCSRCKEIKPIPAFNKNRRRPDGVQSMCRTCTQAGYKRWEKEEARRYNKDTWDDYPVETHLYNSAKSRAKRKGHEFNITIQDIIDITPKSKCCPVLGIPLTPGKGRAVDSSPTLDRIDNERGYVRGNICMMSYRANRLKSDSNPDELERIAHWVRSQTNPNPTPKE